MDRKYMRKYIEKYKKTYFMGHKIHFELLLNLHKINVHKK